MHEQGPATCLERLQEWGHALVPGGVEERRRGQAQTDEPEFELPDEQRRIDGSEARGRPRAERSRECERALVIGGEQLGALVRGQELDPERARQRYHWHIEAVALCLRHPEAGVMLRRIHRVVRLARQLERPSPEARRTPAGTERVDERGRPQVLVDVDVHTFLNRFTEPFH